MNIRATFQDEINNINEYRKMAPGDKVQCEYLMQQKPHGEQQLEPSWEVLHGMYHHQIKEFSDIKKSYQ